MKKLLICISLIVYFACEQPINYDTARTNNQVTDSVGRVVESEMADTRISDLDTINSLRIFREFAISFSPKSSIALLPELPDSVSLAMEHVKRHQPKEFEKYLSLIFVNLYRSHLECCHQSYEIRKQVPKGLDKNQDPLVYEMNLLSKSFQNLERIEMISSNIGHKYIRSHPYLLKFKPIKQQIDLIEQIHKNIAEGVYWQKN